MPAHDDRLNFATQIAREAGEITRKYFSDNSLEVVRKGDGSPVTRADREAELRLRERIAGRYPDDGIVGEEFDNVSSSSAYTWVLDPIDGTKSFIHGVPLYTTLVAVLHTDQPPQNAEKLETPAGADAGVPVIGVIYAPATDEIVYAATGDGCWLSEASGPPKPAKVSATASLTEGLLLTSEVASFATDRQPDALNVYLELQRRARLARTWGDGYGYLMVASGRAEVMIDPIVNLWDIAPMLPIIEEAGGRMTDWQGERSVHRGDAIATNGLLHDAVVAQTRNE